MHASATRWPTQRGASTLSIEPIDVNPTFRAKVNETLRSAVAALNIYDSTNGVRFDERALLRYHFDTFDETELSTHIDEYSAANLDLLFDTAATLFVHMRAIRHKTISENRRFERSIKDHHCIIDTLEDRNAGLAERLVREHTLDRATHIELNANYPT